MPGGGIKSGPAGHLDLKETPHVQSCSLGMGVQAINVAGGTEAWTAAGRPVVTGPNAS